MESRFQQFIEEHSVEFTADTGVLRQLLLEPFRVPFQVVYQVLVGIPKDGDDFSERPKRR